MAQPVPRIAIIGAGPAGTMLARLLHQESIPCTVFEGEESPNYRSQGGTLDLHTSTGLLAIKQAGLWDKFLEKARFEADLLQLADKDLNIVFRKSGSPAPKATKSGNTIKDQRPEIDRSDLRRLLTESLPEGTIQWGSHLKRIEPDGTLVFENGSQAGFDLIVGADGAWSKVRALLSDVKPVYAGVAFHELIIHSPETTTPELFKAVNHGSLFAHAPGRRLTAQEMGDGTLHVSTNMRIDDENWPKNCGYDATNLEEVKKLYLGDDGPFADWHPTLRDAIAKSGPKCIPRTLWQLPVGFRWEHKQVATLIGDAAHLMTPFAGEGVNVALEDAMKLAQNITAAIKGHKEGGPSQLDALDRAVIEYEDEMWPRAHKVQRLTDDLVKLWMFSPDTPRAVLPDMMALHMKYHLSPLAYPLVSMFKYAYFPLMKLVKGSNSTVEV